MTQSGNAANKDRKNLVTAWNWGLIWDCLRHGRVCPFLCSQNPRKTQTSVCFPPESDFWKVFEQAQGQDRIMLLCYLHLGARRSEIFRLCWEDVDFATNRIRLYTKKRRDGSLEYDWLPMTTQLAQALRWWWENRTFTDSPYVFVCKAQGGFCMEQYGKPFKERMKFMHELCAKAGVKPFGFHAIRHLTATILYNMGQPVAVIQAILRHKSPNTTTSYLHSLGIKEARGALESLAARFGDTSPESLGTSYLTSETVSARKMVTT